MKQPLTRTLEGVTLKTILETLVAEHGWEELGRQIHIRCFNLDPSINSSLKFLRKTQWAREKVEVLYLLGINKNNKK
jgi:uncharacterized protein (DUF2132 family)